ncbi:hypothetical protein [Peribacillus sp. Bi134]|uniref:hypothetical protein n=1 Tax=Peribacillus sp. Bi134 TaxID=2884272 RepID=UPI001D78EE06|nr:hypothetical protein [Peribacillus sp. Bi134]CAH0127404.1 hypothetical protein SRABI134_00176 [Peribacillus sp. Bi134]
MNVTEVKNKIDKFTDEFIDKGNVRKDFVEIIETEPELDSNVLTENEDFTMMQKKRKY